MFSESVEVTDRADGATPGSPVTKLPSKQRSGAKPTIVTPLENIEVNDGENVVLQVNIVRLINFQLVGKTVISLSGNCSRLWSLAIEFAKLSLRRAVFSLTRCFLFR